MKKIILAAPIFFCLFLSCSSSSEQSQTQDPAPAVETETEDMEDTNAEDEESDEDEEDEARENRNQSRNTSQTATPSNVTADDFKIDDDMTARIEKTRRQHLGYVFIGSKKELKKLHLLTRKTIFSKRKLSMVNADLNTFQRIKTNTFTTLHIPGKSAKVLSDMPKDSYTITQSGNDCVLKVTDNMAFWQNCNYLVVQSKEDAHKGEVTAKKSKKKKDYSKLKQTAGTVAETAGIVALSLVEGYITQNILVEIATQVLGQTELGRTALDVVEKTTNGKQKIEDLKETFSDAKSKISNLRTKLKDVKLRKSTIEKELKKKGLSINSDLKDLKKALSKEQFKELKSVLKDETKLSEKLKKLESKK